jgi:hypothetical protein
MEVLGWFDGVESKLKATGVVFGGVESLVGAPKLKFPIGIVFSSELEAGRPQLKVGTSGFTGGAPNPKEVGGFALSDELSPKLNCVIAGEEVDVKSKVNAPGLGTEGFPEVTGLSVLGMPKLNVGG